jgi:hypothetical protein
MNSSDVLLQLLNQSIAASQALVSQASDTAQVGSRLMENRKDREDHDTRRRV